MATRTEAGLLYHGWTKPRNTGLFGATWAATIIGFALVMSVMVTIMFAGFGTGVVGAALATVVAAPLVWSRDGRSGYEMTVLRMQWIRARRGKETSTEETNAGYVLALDCRARQTWLPIHHGSVNGGVDRDDPAGRLFSEHSGGIDESQRLRRSIFPLSEE